MPRQSSKPEPDVILEKEVGSGELTPEVPVFVRNTSTTAWSVTALALGVSSLFLWWGVNSVAAIIAGHVAWFKLKGVAEDKQNKILTLIGLISGYIGLIIVIISILFVVASIILLIIAAVLFWLVSVFGILSGR